MKNYKLTYKTQNYQMNPVDFKEFLANRIKLSMTQIVTLVKTNHVTLPDGSSIDLVTDFPITPETSKFKLFPSLH